MRGRRLRGGRCAWEALCVGGAVWQALVVGAVRQALQIQHNARTLNSQNLQSCEETRPRADEDARMCICWQAHTEAGMHACTGEESRP